MAATGYGTCFLDGPYCLPSLVSIDYQAQYVKVSIQNRDTFLGVCYKTDLSEGVGTCLCPICNPSPIMISLEDSSIRLTDAEQGVLFDLDATRLPNQTPGPVQAPTKRSWSWTDGNSVIDDGTELFGDHTPQPIPDGDDRNGFAALAVFDDSLTAATRMA